MRANDCSSPHWPSLTVTNEFDDEGDICDLDDGMIYILFHQTDYVEWQEESDLGTTSGGEARLNANPCP